MLLMIKEERSKICIKYEMLRLFLYLLGMIKKNGKKRKECEKTKTRIFLETKRREIPNSQNQKLFNKEQKELETFNVQTHKIKETKKQLFEKKSGIVDLLQQ